MSKRKREQYRAEVVTDPQAITAAMEDTIEVVSEELPPGVEEEIIARVAALPGTAEDSPDWRDVLKGLAGRDVAGKPSTIHLEDAMTTWALLPADVIGWRGFVPEAESVLVTAGGVKLFWPADMDRTLGDAEKGRALPVSTGEAGGVGRFARTAD